MNASTPKTLSTWQVVFFATGGMFGCGWLFSPYYGFQYAGGYVLLAWLITALLMLLIASSFIKISSEYPVEGGLYELLTMTHSKAFAHFFLLIGWLSYIVYLPLEAQSVIQYLGFWFPALIHLSFQGVQLSTTGALCAASIIFLITAINTSSLYNVTQLNTLISLWKLSIPLLISLVIIHERGSVVQFNTHLHATEHHPLDALMAIAWGGLAFSFSGFHNGLFLAKHTANPRKTVTLSLIIPIATGLLLYGLLSSTYLSTLPQVSTFSEGLNAAPMLSLLQLLGLPMLISFLLADAVLSPLGTTNVYTSITARLLRVIGTHLHFNWLMQLNTKGAPQRALWVNAVISLLFLLPLPTWQQLVNFLSSLIILGYLAGPIASLKIYPDDKFQKILSYGALIGTALLIVMTGTQNMGLLAGIILIYTAYNFIYYRQ